METSFVVFQFCYTRRVSSMVSSLPSGWLATLCKTWKNTKIVKTISLQDLKMCKNNLLARPGKKQNRYEKYFALCSPKTHNTKILFITVSVRNPNTSRFQTGCRRCPATGHFKFWMPEVSENHTLQILDAWSVQKTIHFN